MQREELNAIQIENTDGITRLVSKEANFHTFVCGSEQLVESLPKIVKSTVLETSVSIGGVRFDEGDLMLEVSDWAVKSYAKINNDGDLLIFGTQLFV